MQMCIFMVTMMFQPELQDMTEQMDCLGKIENLVTHTRCDLFIFLFFLDWIQSGQTANDSSC